MIKKTLGLTLLVSSICSTAFASEMQEKAQVLKVIKNYTTSVACGLDEITLKDIFTIDRDAELGSSTYYVLWSGDMGCNLGSGTHSSYVSEVTRYSNTRPFLIIGDDAFNNEKKWVIDNEHNVIKAGINFRFIQSVKQISPSEFHIISWGYADEQFGGKDGGNNFPANKFKYTLNLVDGEGWQITNQQLLEQNN